MGDDEDIIVPGYNLRLPKDADLSRAIPKSGDNFPGRKPKPPPMDENERALRELEAMNANAGFLYTFPLPQDQIRPPKPKEKQRMQKHREEILEDQYNHNERVKEKLRSRYEPPKNTNSKLRNSKTHDINDFGGSLDQILVPPDVAREHKRRAAIEQRSSVPSQQESRPMHEQRGAEPNGYQSRNGLQPDCIPKPKPKPKSKPAPSHRQEPQSRHPPPSQPAPSSSSSSSSSSAGGGAASSRVPLDMEVPLPAHWNAQSLAALHSKLAQSKDFGYDLAEIARVLGTTEDGALDMLDRVSATLSKIRDTFASQPQPPAHSTQYVEPQTDLSSSLPPEVQRFSDGPPPSRPNSIQPFQTRREESPPPAPRDGWNGRQIPEAWGDVSTASMNGPPHMQGQRPPSGYRAPVPAAGVPSGGLRQGRGGRAMRSSTSPPFAIGMDTTGPPVGRGTGRGRGQGQGGGGWELNDFSYESLMELGSMAVTVGLTKQQIAKLPTFVYTQRQGPMDCSICLEAFEEDDTFTPLSCEHIFHQSCILPWLLKNKYCPCCRKDVTRPKHPTTHRHVHNF